MKLPPEFLFSQQKLQDFDECPRRFELKHVVRQAWPSGPDSTQPGFERWTELGQRFHQMVQQSFAGVPAGRIAAQAGEPELHEWWQAFCERFPVDLPARRQAEVERVIILDGARFIAKYDLLAADSERVVIVDWKTSLRKPPRSWLAARWQTRLYPFMLVECGHSGGFFPRPDQIEIRYWFTCDPCNPERFTYSEQAYQADRRDLLRILASLRSAESPLEKASDAKRCTVCSYHALCERDVQPADWQDWLSEEAGLGEQFDFVFDQVPEIAF